MTEIIRVANIISPVSIQPVATQGFEGTMLVPFHGVMRNAVGMIGVAPLPEPTREGFTRADANAAGTIAQHMKQVDSGRPMTWEKIKQRAGDDKLDADTRKAYQHMVNNPEVYKKIETRDVAGADGISSRENFENVAGLFKDAAPAARMGLVASPVSSAWGGFGGFSGWGALSSISSFFQAGLSSFWNKSDRRQ